ncbi:uncharacterized protein PV07_05425 [Cladophialophora immunda]|uniref:Xylanolytic transcriptional activator regulatory domain-containing protein n=1 Tax=Cladophialophora immunda TaxID=569365 RepID=A0A0D2AWH7_9EURO|nr:uncharacterized protein PV07_05425 [Cladophialophora immunda]KIW29622.1 hypothetical protein PV07_05425 [Cladophialophora immunda]
MLTCISTDSINDATHTPAASDTSLFTADSVKNAIVHRLGSLTLEDSLSTYHREIEPWFPIISTTSLHNRLTQTCNTWGEVPLDIALLCISIILVATPPPASPENEHCLSDFKSTYCQVKTWISSTEVLGLNSPQIAQARVLATLFEVAHGLYPAAYISIGATVNAADALTLHPGAAPRSPHSTGDENNWKREESALIWCGILILDRYITVESGSHPSLTRSRFQALQDLLEPVLRLTHSQQQQDEPDISSRLTRLVEATTLLDKIHAILNSPTAEHQIDVEELIFTVQTVINFQTEIDKEVGDQACAHVSGLGPCNTALLLALENGTKVPPVAGALQDCNAVATNSLGSVISTITTTVELFTLGRQSIDLRMLPPFFTILVYKTAAIITRILLMNTSATTDGGDMKEYLRKLILLRNFLGIVGVRWLGCERYLKMLDEDTTPRLLRAMGEGYAACGR